MKNLSFLVVANIVFSVACLFLMIFSLVSNKAVSKYNDETIDCTERSLADSSLFLDTLKADTIKEIISTRDSFNTYKIINYTYHKNGMTALQDVPFFGARKHGKIYNDEKGNPIAVKIQGTTLWACVLKKDYETPKMKILFEYFDHFGNRRIAKNPFACIQ